MKRACLCLLLTAALLSLSIGVPAQDATPQASQDDYAFRLTFYVVQRIERSSSEPASDPLAREVGKLLAADKQEQVRKDLERRIGPPGSAGRDAKYDALLADIDEKLTDKKIGQMRDELSKRGDRAIAGWRWPLCVVAGCR